MDKTQKLGCLLIGREATVAVSEPWDFGGPDGSGSLTGDVVDVDVDDAGRWWLKIAVPPFVSKEGVTVRHLIARRRHADDKSIVDQVAAGERVSADLSYADQVPEDRRLPRRIPKLIGTVSIYLPA